MDYKVVAVFADGTVEERGCATNTDVENFVVTQIRLAEPKTNLADVTITIVDMR